MKMTKFSSPFEDVLNIQLYTMLNRLMFDQHHAKINHPEFNTKKKNFH
jgi:hypothetical protein